ncbi:MAG TPA: hypothetical protein PLE72_03000 [Azospira sp.]|nr:hypothetical protein [Azospira sp.]HNN08173.1 hypothetical protein [Azospira sp.]HNN45545.1 hypothetical protein [Azospira sp.]
MEQIDIAAIERRARQLRAEEIRRIEGLFAERLCVTGRLAAASLFSGLLALAELLRPMFSWNPQDRVAPTRSSRPKIALHVRLNRAVRALFAWNPEVHHHL